MASNWVVNSNPIYQPAMRCVIAIAKGNPTLVTTGYITPPPGLVPTPLNHLYVNGTIVRLTVPLADGMTEIDGMTGAVTVTSPTTFTLPIDSTNFTAFVIPPDAVPIPNTHVTTYAFVVPIGENNAQLTAAVHNIYG